MFRQPLFACVLLAISCIGHTVGFMKPIATTISNHSQETIDLYCQVTNPQPECYGEGCVWSSWPAVKIKPGTNTQLDLWIFPEDGSRLILSVLSPVEAHSTQTDSYVVQHLQNGAFKYLADLTIEMDAVEFRLVPKHTGNLDYRFFGDSDFSLDLKVY